MKKNKQTRTKHKINYKSAWPEVRKMLEEGNTEAKLLCNVSATNLMSAILTGDRHILVDKGLPLDWALVPNTFVIGVVTNDGIYTDPKANKEVAILGFNCSELVKDIANREDSEGVRVCSFVEVSPDVKDIHAPASLIYSVCKKAVFN